MRTPIIDGRSIYQFIPANLRHMFYDHPMPEYKYAIHDGYAPYSFPTKNLVFYLPAFALKGSSFKSVDAYKHVCTVTGALWKPYGRFFDTADDLISADGVVSHLDFGGAHTLIGWGKLAEWGEWRALVATGLHAGVSSDYSMLIYKNKNRFTARTLAQGGLENAVESPATYDNDTDWHFSAMTVDAAGHINHFILDDTDEGSDSVNANDLSNVDGFEIGQYPNSFDNSSVWSGGIGEQWGYQGELAVATLAHIRLATMWRYQ